MALIRAIAEAGVLAVNATQGVEQFLAKPGREMVRSFVGARTQFSEFAPAYFSIR